MRHIKTFENFLNESASYAGFGPNAKEFATKCEGVLAATEKPQLGNSSIDKNRDPEERIAISGSKEGMPWKEYKPEQEKANAELDKKYQEALRKIGLPVENLAWTYGNFGDIGGKPKKKALDLADKLGIKYEVFSVEIDYGKYGGQYKKNELTYVIYDKTM